MQTCHFCPKFWTIECLCVSACESLTKLAFLPPNFVGQSESWNRTLLGIWLAGVSPDSPWACISQSYIDIKYLLNSDWLRKSGVFAPKFDNQIVFRQFWSVCACKQCLCVSMTIEVTGFLYVCFGALSACLCLHWKMAFLPPNFVGQSESWNRTLLGIWLAGVSPDSPWACISQSYIDIKYLLNSDWLRKSGVFAPKFDNQIVFRQFWSVCVCEQCLCVRMTIEVTGFLYVCFFLNPVYYTYYHIRINPFGKNPVWFLAVRHLGQKC